MHVFVPRPSNSEHLVARRLADIGHHGQRVVFDGDELGGVVRPFAGLADHDGDDVPDEADLLRRDERAGTSAGRSG